MTAVRFTMEARNRISRSSYIHTSFTSGEPQHDQDMPSRSAGGPGARLLGMVLVLVLFGSVVYGQTLNTAPHKLPPELRNRCTMCHTCSTPTKLDPCLIVCPRVKESTGLFTPADGPGVILMNKMTNQYGPVAFSHRVHAQMSEMSGGCYGCHHYNDTSLNILSCRSCHPSQRKRENISLPDLKGAYHQQCLDCHRQWSGSVDCSVCHMDKSEGRTPAQILEQYARERKDHPPVLAPDKKVYRTKEQEGTVVTFYHTEHTKLFGKECVDCHRQEGCVSCHDQRAPSLRTTVTADAEFDFDARHARCSSCHAEQSCEKCHTAAETPPFNHGRSTGWTLKPYHARLSCAACHGPTGQFAGLTNECKSCHSSWVVGSFAHAVTGFSLDETHSEFDCTDCHAENAYEKPPTCSGCHTDMTYPKNKPGKVTGK
jgi:hypothetical protein